MDCKKDDWISIYFRLHDFFCKKCEIKCSELKKLLCIEQNLNIIEHWKIEKENMELDKNEILNDIKKLLLDFRRLHGNDCIKFVFNVKGDFVKTEITTFE